ncbi:MAG TPA: tetratricopeptide repeat protein [Candidatus Limnocylindrales bacterium]|nr:tetratricopeptide repeat protein [Candidatus Limnocylindrales bacterium]
MNCPHCSTVNPDFAESCSRCGTPMPVGDSETVVFTDAGALNPGSDFGPRYRIESLLGQGGMGRVYKAYDKDLDRVVALKVVRQGALSESDALRRFKQELLLASKISHKNILRIHDMGEVGGVRFITMAYVEGQDLHQIIADNPKMPLDRVLNFARQFAEALAAAHAEGVIHRDLKPQNILVGKGDQIYISDFGLAKSFDEGAVGMTRSGAFLGTPRYMSPEQVEGKPADQRSDLYAYGLILYEMVTGDVPFTGESTLKVMYQRVQEKAKSPKLANPELPNWLVRLILHCLERAPEARYQSAYEILADLQGAKSGSAVTRSGSQTVVIQIPEFAQRRWTWWVAGAALVVGLFFAVPITRHLVFRSAGSTSVVSGVPPLSTGKYIAVLPFRVLGDDQSLGFVADGLNEALTSKLFQFKQLHLASDSDVAKVSTKDSLEKTARNLGVNIVVSGQIQGSSDKMLVIVDLRDVADGKRLWSGQFPGVPNDLLTLEDQISNQLVSALNVNATSEELALSTSHPTENVAAYDLYLRGRNVLRGQQDVKNDQAAADLFAQAVEKDPKFALAYSGLADASLAIYAAKKDAFWSQRALSAALQAQRLNDSAAEVHFSLGRVYQATGKTAEAISELQRALKIEPNSDEGYRELGAAYLGSNRASDALQAFQKAIDINPYYWLNYNALGGAYYQTGDLDKALAAFRKITEIEPDNSAGYDNVGLILLQQGKYEDSIPQFQKSISLAGSNDSAYSNLGDAYFQLKRYSDAVTNFAKAVELNPTDNVNMGNLADAYRWSGQKDKADATYDKAIELAYKDLQVNPRSSAAMASLALYYAKKGQSKQALDFIGRARTIDKQNVNVTYDEVVVDTLASRPDDALKALREALQKGYSFKDAKSDPELASLESRPGFAQLEKEFGGGAK